MPASETELIERARSRVGSVLGGKYRLDHLIGVSAVFSVYAGSHLRNASQVAVKILHRELMVDATVRARFLRGGYAANSVGHPAAVRVLDDDVADDGAVYVVMDLLDGETLEARWKRSGGKLPVGEVVAHLCDLLEVLVCAHAKGIVHGDLKPENLFVTRDGRLKVLDFGLARLFDTSVRGHPAVFGSGPAFVPPERARGRALDALSDIWSAGATGFLLLTGRSVHEGSSVDKLFAQAAKVPVLPVSAVSPEVPPALAAILDRALAFDKRKRWASAEAMRQALTGLPADVLAHDEDESDELTWIALPPEMSSDDVATPAPEIGRAGPTAPPVVQPSVPAPAPAPSSVAGMVTTSRARSTGARRAAAVVGASAGVLLGAAVVAVLLASSSRTDGSASASRPGAMLGAAAGGAHGANGFGDETTPASTIPVVAVEALPLAARQESPHPTAVTPEQLPRVMPSSAAPPSGPPVTVPHTAPATPPAPPPVAARPPAPAPPVPARVVVPAPVRPVQAKHETVGPDGF